MYFMIVYYIISTVMLVLERLHKLWFPDSTIEFPSALPQDAALKMRFPSRLLQNAAFS